LIFGIQGLERFELRGVTAFTGGIDHQKHFSGVGFLEIDLLFTRQSPVLMRQHIGLCNR